MSRDDDHLFTDHIKKFEITIDQKIAFLKIIKILKKFAIKLGDLIEF